MSALSQRLRAATTTAPRPGWTLATLFALVVIVALAGQFFGNSAYVRATSTLLVSLIAVVGMYTFIGNSGVFSFGHTGFIAIGAYTTAALRIPDTTKKVLFPSIPAGELGFNEAILVGGIAAGVIGVLVAMVVSRLGGLSAALVTFAFMSIVYVVIANLKPLTGGQTGISGVPLLTTPLTALPWALFAVLVAWAFGESRTSLRLRATREDDVPARSLGISVWRTRVVAFTISAFLCGIAGGVLAQYLGSFNPEAFYLDMTLLTMAMLVVGGARSLSGAVVGTVFLALVREVLRQFESGVAIGPLEITARPGLQNLGVAAALLLVLLFIPSGLTRGRELGAYVAALFSRRRSPLPETEGGAS